MQSNDVWCTEFKVSTSQDLARAVFEQSCERYGLPTAIRTDNGVLVLPDDSCRPLQALGVAFAPSESSRCIPRQVAATNDCTSRLRPMLYDRPVCVDMSAQQERLGTACLETGQATQCAAASLATIGSRCGVFCRNSVCSGQKSTQSLRLPSISSSNLRKFGGKKCSARPTSACSHSSVNRRTFTALRVFFGLWTAAIRSLQFCRAAQHSQG